MAAPLTKNLKAREGIAEWITNQKMSLPDSVTKQIIHFYFTIYMDKLYVK